MILGFFLNEENIMMCLISNEMLVEQYGDRHDGIKVYKGSRAVGFLTDLRKKYASNEKLKRKSKEYRNKRSEERLEMLPEAVEEMKEFLDNQLAKYDCKVFVNITQPNVHINGCKCYIIVDPIYQKHRLGIVHSNMNYSEMAEELETCFNLTPSNHPNHILISGMSQDDIVETIVKICLN